MEGYRELIANKKIRILLCVELLLIAFGIAGLFRGSRLAVGTEDTEQLLGEGVSLPAGVYTARLYCESEEDGVSNILLKNSQVSMNSCLSSRFGLG